MYAGGQIFPIATLKGAIPWWSLPVNWIIGKLALSSPTELSDPPM